MEPSALIDVARDARSNAYAPVTEFAVGAALHSADGTVYTGCNIENINLTNTIHAEQTALACAISDGVDRDAFDAIAISAPGEACPPCGLCRQSLSEHCPGDMPVYVDTGDARDPDEHTLDELLPASMREILEPGDHF